MTDAVSSLPSAQGVAGESRASLADNFEMFLTLLTEQLQNQDPLDPLDSNQFVSQLVEFSSVEQLINQTESLETIAAIQSGSSAAAAVGYIGRDAVLDGPEAPLADGSASWSYTLEGPADVIELQVLDATGRVVARADGANVGGEQDFVWDGRDGEGALLPPGAYTLAVQAFNASGDPVDATIRARGRVTGVDFTGEEPAIALGPVRAPLASVLSVSEPEAPPAS